MKSKVGEVLIALCASLFLLIAGADAARADQTYLPEADAPRTIFPESTGAERKALDLSEAELHALSLAVGRKVDASRYVYFDVHRQGEPLGAIFLLDVVGQSRPISFAIGVSTDGALRDMEVMVYREPQGEQIHEARFRRQFVGKRAKDPIALGRDVDVISGATISSRAATYAARKALALAEILHARGASR